MRGGDAVEAWLGEDWQEYCNELLAVRHEEGYQPVPDGVHGDWGIEGYCDNGTLFQCYAAEEPISAALLYERQRDKTTTDLGKLVKNLERICELLNPSKVKRWVLMVPRTEDKRILEHAATKASEIRERGLECIDDDFDIRVLTLDDFSAEARALGDPARLSLPTLAGDVHGEVSSLYTESATEVEALSAKLQKLGPDRDIDQLRTEILQHYVRGTHADDALRRLYPATWERWDRQRTAIEQTLKMQELVSQAPAHVRLDDLWRELEDAAAEAAPSLDRSGRLPLAWGAVSRWLVECPLDFGAPVSG